MAYSKTTWVNGTAPSINSTNLNKLENGIYNNDSYILTGWYPVTETVTYSSVDNPTGVAYFTGDVTAKYGVGMRGKMTNNGNTIYFIITLIGNYNSGNNRTPVTFLHEIDYPNNTAVHLLQNSAITNVYISNVYCPFGFPINKDNWTLIITNSTNLNQTSPTPSLWYNLGGLYLDVAVGSWYLSYFVIAEGIITSGTQSQCKTTLSKNTTSETNSEFSTFLRNTGTNPTISAGQGRGNRINLDTKTRFYLNEITYMTGQTTLAIRGDNGTTIIKAVCDYL